MSYTLDSFADSAREILQADNTPAGREKLATLLRAAIAICKRLQPGTCRRTRKLV